METMIVKSDYSQLLTEKDQNFNPEVTRKVDGFELELSKIKRIGTEDVEDFPIDELKNKYFLYVCARDNQLKRNEETTPCVFYWELDRAGYIENNMILNKARWKEYDVIVFTDPSRVHPNAREAYKRLIDAVKEL